MELRFHYTKNYLWQFSVRPIVFISKSCFVWLDSSVRRIFREDIVRRACHRSKWGVFFVNCSRNLRSCLVVTPVLFSRSLFRTKRFGYTKMMGDKFYEDRKSKISKMRCFRGLHGKRFCFDFDLMRDFLGITHEVLPKVILSWCSRENDFSMLFCDSLCSTDYEVMLWCLKISRTIFDFYTKIILLCRKGLPDFGQSSSFCLVLVQVFSAHDRGKRCCIVLEILFVMA